MRIKWCGYGGAVDSKVCSQMLSWVFKLGFKLLPPPPPVISLLVELDLHSAGSGALKQKPGVHVLAFMFVN